MTSPPKIVIGTLLWKRHEVFRVWAEALIDAATEPYGVVVAGSEGDISRELVESYGFSYVETPNRPLGAKANTRLAACRELDPDYVVLCGSDDIVSPQTFAHYRNLAADGIDEVTINDIYYFNAHTQQMAYSRGYENHRRGEPVAPWRMLSRRLCEALEWSAWDPEALHSLDTHSAARLSAIPHREHRIHVRDEGLFVCDIKCSDNLTAWKMRPNWESIPRSLLSEHLSPGIIAKLDGLKERLIRAMPGKVVRQERGDNFYRLHIEVPVDKVQRGRSFLGRKLHVVIGDAE